GQISKIVYPQNIAAHSGKTSKNEIEKKGAPTTEASGDATTQHSIAPYPGTNQLGRYNQSPLIGRSRELETMREILLSIEGIAQEPLPSSGGNGAASNSLRATYAKQTRVLLLMGEAGIGKTRLAEELSHEAYTRGWAVAWTRAYEQEGTVPYRPWIELLRTLLQNIPVADLVSSSRDRPINGL
ncbi:MAG TPA: ATP-binding protein, partial [Ktedonobacteraceae bacterium]|nr:ATP-binding protein [Ktedonobacteraceae bacterium]